MLSVHRTTIYTLMASGALPSFRVGQRVRRIRVADIEAWMAAAVAKDAASTRPTYRQDAADEDAADATAAPAAGATPSRPPQGPAAGRRLGGRRLRRRLAPARLAHRASLPRSGPAAPDLDPGSGHGWSRS